MKSSTTPKYISLHFFWLICSFKGIEKEQCDPVDRFMSVENCQTEGCHPSEESPFKHFRDKIIYVMIGSTETLEPLTPDCWDAWKAYKTLSLQTIIIDSRQTLMPSSTFSPTFKLNYTLECDGRVLGILLVCCMHWYGPRSSGSWRGMRRSQAKERLTTTERNT